MDRVIEVAKHLPGPATNKERSKLNQIKSSIAVMVTVVALTLSAMSVADASDAKHDDENLRNGNKVVIYFTRHAEKKTTLTDLGDGKFMEFCNADRSRCGEELNSEGLKRAELLVEWFNKRKITAKLTHAFSSHKLRTLQTIEMIAADAGLSGDFDKNENDGVQELPVYADNGKFATELNPGSTTPSEQPTIDALLNLPVGSVALVAGHSGTLYDIMAGLGLTDVCTGENVADPANITCDQNRYPVSGSFKVRDFGDIWQIELKPNGAKFKSRRQLDFDSLKTIDKAS